MKPKSTLPPEQIALLIDQAEKEKGYNVCGYASLLEDGDTVVCKNTAGKGTDHLGMGNCRHHGGCGASKTTGGLYSKYTRLKPELYERFQEFLDDETIKKLDGEIALLRTKLSKVIESGETWETGKFDYSLLRIIGLIGTTVEKKSKIEDGDKYTITIENLDMFLKQIMAILKEELGDLPERLVKILQRMQNEVKV